MGTNGIQSVEQITQAIYESLQRLTGLHRSLMDTVRLEREALISAEVKRVEETTVAKQGLVEAIRQAESKRILCVAELAVAWRKPVRELTLPKLIVAIQGENPKFAEQLRTAYNALTILIKRITDQNRENQKLVEESLVHVQQMKTNILGETIPKANTYTAKGQKSGISSGARLISRDA
jgi:flagellar biosynthesis/type III secretory pathway chaperone